MSMVAVSLNTETRECVLTIDGIQVSAKEVNLYKYEKYDEPGVFDVGFSYTTIEKDSSGLEKRVSFRLPYPDEEDNAFASRNEQGFVVEDGAHTKVASDVARFLRNR